MTYTPNEQILDNYANVLINFALHNMEGVKANETVVVIIPESAKPLYKSLQKIILQANAHPLFIYLPEGVNKDFYTYADSDQINQFMDKYYKGIVDQADHLVRIISEADKKELVSIPAKKLMAKQKSMKPFMDWRFEKERQGKMSWTLALYATQSMADEAGLTIEGYWEEIINACFLREEDPVAKWKEVATSIATIREKLTALDIKKIHVKSERTDLTIGLGDKRKWLSGSGNNIPSFEIFTSPDWRETQGHIQFTEPLYRYGAIIKDAYLAFEDGIVTKATASEGEEAFKEMIAVEGADKVGEFSLTDKRFSNITKFMAETLFDENVGGEYGNTHIAIGMAYKDAFNGKIESVSDKEWIKLGFNDSAVHTDIVSTENRTVTATLADGTQIVIYKDGEFTV